MNNIFLMSLKVNFKNKKILFFVYLFLKIILIIIPSITLFLNNRLYNYLSEEFERNIVIAYLIGYLLSSVLLYSVFNTLSILISIKIKEYSKIESQKIFNQFIVNIDYELMENNEIYNDINVMNSLYTNLLSEYIFRVLDIIFSLFTIITLVISLFTFKFYLLTIIVILISLLYYFVIKKNNSVIYYEKLKRIPEVREGNYLYRILSNRSSLKEIKTDESSSFIIDQWNNKHKKIIRETNKLRFTTVYKKIYIDLVYFLVFNIIIFLLIINLRNKNIDIGTFTSLYYGFISINSFIVSLISSILNINLQSKEYKKRMYLLNQNEKIKTNVHFEKEIKLENINYAYPNSPSNVINEITLSICKGEKIGIVGENGCGKTTLLKIILGLLTPQSGVIKIDNKIISNYNISNISGLFQNFITYASTIENAVVLNKPYDKEKLNKIYKTVKLDKLIESFDLKDKTTIGQTFPNSVELSGGEKQRLAFARCLYNDDAELYFLDEPTSSLDVNFEVEVYKMFLNELKNKTVIMISHRLAFAHYMDKLIVMDKGKIIEFGSHDELMHLKGHYYNMYAKQLELIEGINKDK